MVSAISGAASSAYNMLPSVDFRVNSTKKTAIIALGAILLLSEVPKAEGGFFSQAVCQMTCLLLPASERAACFARCRDLCQNWKY